MSDENRSSRSEKRGTNTEASSGGFSAMTLTDKLQLLGVIVGLIGVAVAVYFGYLSLRTAGNPPAGTPIATSLTPVETATAAVPGTVFLEDDFENGLAKWRSNQAWEIRDDGKGNHYVCAQPTGSGTGYSMIFPRAAAAWGDYIFSVGVMLVDALPETGLALDVHHVNMPRMLGYQFQITDPVINLWRFDPDVGKWQRMTTYETGPLKLGKWYDIQIEIRSSGLIQYSIDKKAVIEFTDSEAFVPEGGVRLGASANSNVCFDDVRVIVP